MWSPLAERVVARLIANLPENLSEEDRWHAERLRALPIGWGFWTGYYLRAEGEAVIVGEDMAFPDLDTFSTEPNEVLTILAWGARRYPELRPLLPVRGPGAVDCWCRQIPVYALCPTCCGLGWVSGDADSSPGSKAGEEGGPAERSVGSVRGVPEAAGPRPGAIGVAEPKVVHGDLLDQDVEVIVNAWNRNVIPWWLLLPQGVSGAIKRRAGRGPFRELGRMGAIPLGGAVETGAGELPFRGIIHVAGINMLWRSSERSIRGSVRSAMGVVRKRGYRSVAFPLIGAGSGGGRPERVLEVMRDELRSVAYGGEVRIVLYQKGR